MNDNDLPKGKKILCIDFDGVLHSYDSGWKGPLEIPDKPVEGAIAWLKELIIEEPFDLAIYSSRSRYPGGIQAMQLWLLRNGLSFLDIDHISFPTEKPPAFLQIDDRCMCFEGVFPTITTMKLFQPWNKKHRT